MALKLTTKYDASLKAMISADAKNIARYVLHRQELFASEEGTPKLSAVSYVSEMADRFQISKPQLNNMHTQVNYYEPKTQPMELRTVQQKKFFDSTTIGITQTVNNVPLWRKGLSVTLKEGPSRIISSVNNTVPEFAVKLPTEKNIERFNAMFNVTMNRPVPKLLSAEGRSDDAETGNFVRSVVAGAKVGTKTTKQSAKSQPARLIRGRFYYYEYDAQGRQRAEQPRSVKRAQEQKQEDHNDYYFPLPPVDKTIRDGKWYLVAEVTFAMKMGDEMVPWLALVEVETNSILYIEPLTAGVDGKVFVQDPITGTGNTANTANLSNAALEPFTSMVALPNIDPVDGMGDQHLSGTNVHIVDVDGRSVAAPVETGGTAFNYDVRTNDFAAVSAYYHADTFFSTVESLGFDLPTYFTGTTFPVDIDHADQSNVNAHCAGNGTSGIDHSGYGYGDETNTVDPTIGRAPDSWVHWHELGGHGVLYGFVDTWHFGFAHSAGDGMAAIRHDPTSQLRELGSTERFRYAPFRYFALDRWFNRDETAGWAWGGMFDIGDYESEQILATTHFRIYRSLGGDSTSLSRRQFASRMSMYLILRAISTLTPGTNPANALGFCDALMAVDLMDWTSEGLTGGAYNKVIRWAFEKQGLYQPMGAPTPVVSAGAPPDVDVYINDGREGEYQYQHVHWNNISMWNRHTADGMTGHLDAQPGVTNYMYMKVKNRGTVAATNVTIKGYHCLPGAGLTWPNDFTEMSPIGGLNVASIDPNGTEEITVGPFEWIPNENIYGHDCTLMIASNAEDTSNVDNFDIGETIAEWRLVPHDNNIGQRNVQILPGGGESELMASLDERIFWAGNSFNHRAKMELKVELPRFLMQAGWKVQLLGVNEKFELKSGEKRKITIKLIKGGNFTAEDVRKHADRDIKVFLYGNEQLLGGMTYRIDPDKKPTRKVNRQQGDHMDKAGDLLNSLNFGGAHVKKVCVKKVSIDIELDNGCGCD